MFNGIFVGMPIFISLLISNESIASLTLTLSLENFMFFSVIKGRTNAVLPNCFDVLVSYS